MIAGDDDKEAALNVVIVDDEALARDRLFRMIGALSGYRVIAAFAEGQEALKHIPILKPDLVLLDIAMPGLNGIEVAKGLAILEEPPAIVFCTAFDQYAVQAFETGAVGYLLKPVRNEKLVNALESAGRLNNLQLGQLAKIDSGLNVGADTGAPAAASEQPSLRIASGRGIRLIPLADICCYLAEGKYVRAVHSSGEEIMEESLMALEEQMAAQAPGAFVRCHRSALVRIGAIQSLDPGPGGYSLGLRDHKETPPVSRRHLQEIRTILLGTSLG